MKLKDEDAIGVPLREPELFVHSGRAGIRHGGTVGAGHEVQHAQERQKPPQDFAVRPILRRWVRAVVDATKDTVGTGSSIADVAYALHTSVRTLQRRLTASGMSFRQVRDLARSELASRLLSETNVPIAEIARRLGFEEPASFTVAFRRWSGRTPSQYRASPPPAT